MFFKQMVRMFVALMILMTGAQQSALAAASFENVAIRLEQNVTDQDAEVVMDIKAGVGLKELIVTGPKGDRIVDLESKQNPRLGLMKFLVETPEPSLDDIIASYPEGTYRFRGRTIAGKKISGTATLSHEMPAAPTIVSPAAGAVDVALNAQAASWEAVEGAVGYFIELEQEDLGLVLKVDMQASVTSFQFPDGWLLPDKDYLLGVMAIGSNGNRSGSEVRFHTAAN